MPLPAINTKTFTFDSNPSPDSARYVGVGQTASMKDQLQVRRVAPKVSANNPGVSRTYEKRVISEVVNGKIVDAIRETVTSIPVGVSAATQTALRADSAAFATSTAGIALVEKGTINF